MKSITELTQSLNKWATIETNKMQLDLFESIRSETPVRTGKARDGWKNAQISKMGETGVINNDVEYIGWLEFGSDTVAPQAMVRRNIKRVAK